MQGFRCINAVPVIVWIPNSLASGSWAKAMKQSNSGRRSTPNPNLTPSANSSSTYGWMGLVKRIALNRFEAKKS